MKKKPTGAPKKKIDAELVYNLARIGCTQDEIAVIVGCSKPTLRKHCSSELHRGLEEMKMSLRRWQFEKAEQGNVVMLIWLGKQYLGQREKADTTVTEQVVTIERIEPKLGLAESA
jgi:predicted transcriptional regulator